MSKFLISLNQLEQWFQNKKRILPWRDDPTPYRVWISEIMLQQTQVVAVIPYFEKFISHFPHVKDLALAPLEDVLKLWAGLGYYSRARNLHRGAQKIFQEGLPANREQWLEIPGVGPYTAGAILSISANLPEPILDANVERVLSRVRRVRRVASERYEYKGRLWRLARIFVETGFQAGILPSRMNQGLMELGATLCTPKKPRCEICPLQEICRAFLTGEQNFFPPKKPSKIWISVEENLHCVISVSGKVLLEQRKGGQWRAGLWDLLVKNPQKLFSQPQLLGKVETRHTVTRHKIQRLTQVWRLSEPVIESEMRWVTMSEPEVPVGSALKKTLAAVSSHYKIGERSGEDSV